MLRYYAGVIVGVRFMYGLRIVGPIAIDMSEVPAWRFILFNLIGAAIWALPIAGVGYLFDQTLQWLITDIKRYEGAALLLIISLALVFGLLRRLRRKRHERSQR